MNAVHNDDQATREYDVHNLWSLGMSKAAYTALATVVHPGKRPFIISRSTGIGSGQWAGHWGGKRTAFSETCVEIQSYLRLCDWRLTSTR